MILVTGARGFIGSNLINHLNNQGNQVKLLSRAEIFRMEENQIFLDLTSKDHIGQLKELDLRPDTVIHLAGHIEIALQTNEQNPSLAPVPGKENLSRIYLANLISTVNVIEYCRDTGVKHIIFASSQAVYGLPATERVTEETPCNPLEHYALSKECCEKILRLVASDSLAVTIFRFPGVYSEKREKGTVYRFCHSAVETGVIHVAADLPLPFDAIHLDDVLDAFARAVKAGGQEYSLYNIATGEPNNLNILADRIAGLVPGCRVEHTVCPQPVIQLDSTKAYKKFQWKAVPSSVRLRQVLDTVHHD